LPREANSYPRVKVRAASVIRRTCCHDGFRRTGAEPPCADAGKLTLMLTLLTPSTGRTRRAGQRPSPEGDGL
jgi:hypothetical protein